MQIDDEEIRMTLRLPSRLRDEIKGAAEEAGRSINGEIVQRLEGSFTQAGNAERITKIELERKWFAKLYDSERRSRQVGDQLHHHAKALLFIFSDLIRRYGEGDTQALETFVEQAKLNPKMLDFQMPENLEREEDDEL